MRRVALAVIALCVFPSCAARPKAVETERVWLKPACVPILDEAAREYEKGR